MGSSKASAKVTKSALASPLFQRKVSAALPSRDTDEGRASLDDPGCCLGAGAPHGVRGLLSDDL